MLLMTRYTLKANMSKAETTEMMTLFGKVGEAPGTLFHYVSTNGDGGWILTESDDAKPAYRNLLNYTAYLSTETTVVLGIDDAVPLILDSLA